MSVSFSVNLLWGCWYVTWIAAVVFSAKTKLQMKTDIGGAHRYAAGLGAILIFLPSVADRAGSFQSGLWLPFRRLWVASGEVQWALFSVVALCFGFCWWARLHLGRLWSGFVTIKEGHKVVESGPYGLVRHPIYTGVMSAALVTALIRASPAALIGCLLITLGFTMTARIEETFLTAQLGAEKYGAYRRRVGMLIPGWR